MSEPTYHTYRCNICYGFKENPCIKKCKHRLLPNDLKDCLKKNRYLHPEWEEIF